MITIEHLTKTFGAKKAIDDVSFTAADGKVTGFLGPNGAGKSTTMRAALGLIRAESGQALIDGHPFTSLRSPMAEVGSVLNPRSAHKNRSARSHLEALAYSNGIPKSRVDEVMAIAGISAVGKKKAGSFSLGMSQRLSIAAALLGDPQNLVFDEPVNGLDPEGVMWVRQLCRYYASQGRCVLLSSHLMSEVAQTADDLVIIGQGRVLEHTSVADFLSEHSSHTIRIATPQASLLQQALQGGPEVSVELLPPSAGDPAGAQVLRVGGMELAQVAQIAADKQIVIYEFREEKASLEEAYMALTHGKEEYKTANVPVPGLVSAQGTSQEPIQAPMQASMPMQSQMPMQQTPGQAQGQGATQPAVPGQFAQPVQPTQPVQPVVPMQPNQQGYGQPAPQQQTVQPQQFQQPVQPVQTEPVQPVQPEPMQPVQPVQPVQLIQPEQPVQTQQPIQQQPVHPVQSQQHYVQPADNQQPSSAPANPESNQASSTNEEGGAQ
ncbi:hypothetical protein KIMH_01300 [Bombiscardovia apis]|uniref:ABC transporter domain-containing protein n=1 Tax=Bombiscardovia apis TaxID=2932182 RepID=A0ABM8BAZ5_9BIFI|nr:hypothetical protein KIMH_01300 [Bombiscardovia apis]